MQNYNAFWFFVIDNVNWEFHHIIKMALRSSWAFLEIFIENKTNPSKFVLILSNDLNIRNDEMQYLIYKLKIAKYLESNFAIVQYLKTYRCTVSIFINITPYFSLSCNIRIDNVLFWLKQINDFSYMCVLAQKRCIIYFYLKNTFVIIVLKAGLQICVHVRSHLLIILDNNPRLF